MCEDREVERIGSWKGKAMSLRRRSYIFESDDQGNPWTMSPVRYQYLKKVHDPWIAEISPAQYAAMGKQQKAAYDKKRRGEWDASAKVKQQWRDEVIEAYKKGEFEKNDLSVSQEAHDVVVQYEIAQNKAREEAEKKQKNKAAEITDASQIKVGDKVWHVIFRQYGIVKKVSRKSALVDFGRMPQKVPIDPRVALLRWEPIS